MIAFICIVYLSAAICYLLIRVLRLAPKALPVIGILFILPLAPIVYAPKAWNHQPKWLVMLALLAYLSFVFLLIYGSLQQP